MTHIEVVQSIYAAFGRGDVPAILAHLSPDVQWECEPSPADLPWLQLRLGRDGAKQFFATLAQLDIVHFEPTMILGSGSLVVALIDSEVAVRQTGRRFTEKDEVHLWYFDADGLIARFRHRVDTYKQWLAAAR